MLSLLKQLQFHLYDIKLKTYASISRQKVFDFKTHRRNLHQMENVYNHGHAIT